MIEQLAQNPTVATIIVMLLMTIAAFLKGTITSVACVRRSDVEQRERELMDRIVDERARADRWMEIGMRATGVATDLVEVAKQRDDRDREGKR